MNDINKIYEYKIPDDQFIDSFVENKLETFEYNGPATLVVTVPSCGSAYTQKLDGPVYDGEITVEIDVENGSDTEVAIADLLYGRPYDYVAEFTNVTLEDGTVYQEQTNRTIHDYYHLPVYNFETKSFNELEIVVKDTLTPKMREFISRADMFIEMLNMFELDADSATKLEAFKTDLEKYRAKVATPWKYPENNPFDTQAPKIPMSLVTQLNAAKDLIGEDTFAKLK